MSGGELAETLVFPDRNACAIFAIAMRDGCAFARVT
jgi:hypothetical protein